MVAIPINPSSVANAATYTASSVAIPFNACKPPQEGMRGMPLQFAFNVNTAWIVNTANLAPSAPLSQVAAMFVDTTQCQYDINIIFPDTGYQRRVPFGDSVIIPVLTRNNQPTFYVVSDSENQASADLCNIILLNQFMPETLLEDFKRVVSYGYGSMKSLVPVFAQSSVFNAVGGISLIGTPITIIPNTQWYITGMNINVGSATGGTYANGVLELLDSGNIIGRYLVLATNANSNAQLLTDVAGLNYVSSGNGPLTAVISSVGGSGFNGITALFNIYGGVLIT